MPYVKVWTTIFNKDWFVGMKINGRSIILQLYLLAKQYGDTGEITFSSWSQAADTLATHRSTLARTLSYLSRNGQLTYGKLPNGSVRITLIDYETYQSLTAKEVYQRDREKLSKSCQKRATAEHSKAEQTI